MLPVKDKGLQCPQSIWSSIKTKKKLWSLSTSFSHSVTKSNAKTNVSIPANETSAESTRSQKSNLLWGYFLWQWLVRPYWSHVGVIFFLECALWFFMRRRKTGNQLRWQHLPKCPWLVQDSPPAELIPVSPEGGDAGLLDSDLWWII